ncbi:MAG: C25 family cysteine peptidase [Holophagae bacterium]
MILPCLVAAWLTPAVSAADAPPTFKIYVEHAAVYELSYERLADAGLDDTQSTDTMGLRNFGEPVPLWIEDGGDGRFGPGDRILFLGEVLRGTYSYLDPYSRFNCYTLSFDDPDGRRGTTTEIRERAPGAPGRVLVRHHLESDRIMVRFRPKRGQPEESWYWERLSVADRHPFEHELVIDGLVAGPDESEARLEWADALSSAVRSESGREVGAGRDLQSRVAAMFDEADDAAPKVHLRLGLRGWSEPRHRERDALPHHELDVRLNGEPIGEIRWDTTEHYVQDLVVDGDRLTEGVNTLELRVPKRHYPASGDLVVDVVLLNWIEIEYRRLAVVGREQMRVYPDHAASPHAVVIASDDGSPIELYRSDGVRRVGVGGALTANLEQDGDGVAVLKRGAAAQPNEVVLDRPSHLRDTTQQADYIMITHRRLQRGAERLAEFHRGRGLSVAVVDVQDIYDEFHGGVISPRAIRDFLQYAHDHWPSPAPRFVLLVGDASWDYKNASADDANYADWTYRPGETRRFVKNSSTPYAEEALPNDRNLIPTSSFPTTEGHAASDTWFVCLDDEDELPDMAIGRIPVVEPDELDGVIDKIVGYVSDPPVGPWRRQLLFIANESPAFQRRSDLIADSFEERGYMPTKIYPHPSEPANEHHTRRIIEVFDRGVFAVQFLGHGGRYIWRTGPPDLEKNHDLFTLDHLDQLALNQRLPVVLSLTCYSAPFDHPTADSIGEKLIRIPGRGAIAVFAASWRNSPSPNMGQALLDQLTVPGNTIGEAVMRAKRDFRSPVLVQTYNLLGDPAVPVAAPAHDLTVELGSTDGAVELHVGMPASLESGTLIVDWVAGDGTVLREDRLPVSGRDFHVRLDSAVAGELEGLIGARVYVWDEGLGIDGVGSVDIAPPQDSAEPTVADAGTSRALEGGDS